jgi:hypothetical protein
VCWKVLAVELLQEIPSCVLADPASVVVYGFLLHIVLSFVNGCVRGHTGFAGKRQSRLSASILTLAANT